MAKIVAVIRDRLNGDPVAGENVNFRTPGGTILDTEVSSADGSATYQANGNSAGLIKWDATVSGEQREASARAQRQIGAWFEAELAKSFQGIVSNGVSAGDGDECAVVPGSGRQVIVGTGCIWVLGVPFHFYDDTPLTAAANATGSTRLDRVVLRCDFNLANTTYGMGVLTYVTGTTSLPTLNTDESGTYDYLLADISAANGYSSFTVGNITDQREIAGPSSHVHVMADISDLAAALALKANLAAPAFTGGVGVTGQLTANSGIATTFVTATTNVSMTGNLTVGGTVSIPDASLAIADTSGLQAALDAKATSSSPTLANPTFTGTVTVPDAALAIADTSGLQTALDAKATTAAVALKADIASPTFTGTTTVANFVATGSMDLGNATSDDLTVIGSIRSEKTVNPTVTVNTSVAGTGASAGISGTDVAGIVTVTVATANGATTGKIADVDFGATKPDGGFVVCLTPHSSNAGDLALRTYVTNRGTGGWDLQLQTSGGGAMATGSYIWGYIVIEYES